MINRAIRLHLRVVSTANSITFCFRQSFSIFGLLPYILSDRAILLNDSFTAKALEPAEPHCSVSQWSSRPLERCAMKGNIPETEATQLVAQLLRSSPGGSGLYSLPSTQPLMRYFRYNRKSTFGTLLGYLFHEGYWLKRACANKVRSFSRGSEHHRVQPSLSL